MKALGIIILIIGLIITIFTGVEYVTEEKVAQVGPIEVTADKEKSIVWSPVAGIVVMVIGGAILLVAAKK